MALWTDRDHPDVAGRCPACRGESLFLGTGGHVTCSRLDCPDPGAADDLLSAGRALPTVLGGAVRKALVVDPPTDLAGAQRMAWEAGRNATAARVLTALDAPWGEGVARPVPTGSGPVD